MISTKRIVGSPAAQGAIGTLAAWYLKLVRATSSTMTFDPPDVITSAPVPVIIAMWHGQHFMAPFIKPKSDSDRFRAKVLISRHRDGEINAIAAERLGIGTIRGSGAHNGEFHRKGGAAAFTEMLSALEQGYNIALTADVPKISRVAGMGVVKLAQHSGRPIYPAAIASSRRIQLDNWDRSAINLPFSRMAFIAGNPITVPRDADKPTLEACRQLVESELNKATARAYAVVDRTGSANT
jgi:lysophospholipid acyltransferase (LPLAT)-like uncharacterized protein